MIQDKLKLLHKNNVGIHTHKGIKNTVRALEYFEGGHVDRLGLLILKFISKDHLKISYQI